MSSATATRSDRHDHRSAQRAAIPLLLAHVPTQLRGTCGRTPVPRCTACLAGTSPGRWRTPASSPAPCRPVPTPCTAYGRQGSAADDGRTGGTAAASAARCLCSGDSCACSGIGKGQQMIAITSRARRREGIRSRAVGFPSSRTWLPRDEAAGSVVHVNRLESAGGISPCYMPLCLLMTIQNTAEPAPIEYL